MQEKIELVDFKGKFAEYFMKWTLDHKDEIEKDELDEQELYYDLYDKDTDDHDNDLMFQKLLAIENIKKSSLGIIRIDFFKDESGVHVFDIHYPD